jgi:hypothetical protein
MNVLFKWLSTGTIDVGRALLSAFLDVCSRCEQAILLFCRSWRAFQDSSYEGISSNSLMLSGKHQYHTYNWRRQFIRKDCGGNGRHLRTSKHLHHSLARAQMIDYWSTLKLCMLFLPALQESTSLVGTTHYLPLPVS